ncbi:hypothetical protein J6590_024494 [Homalodisca vitripennis]|nr:hypothetical protein J6590_024494 [Homalodisca vitripennis]
MTLTAVYIPQRREPVIARYRRGSDNRFIMTVRCDYTCVATTSHPAEVQCGPALDCSILRCEEGSRGTSGGSKSQGCVDKLATLDLQGQLSLLQALVNTDSTTQLTEITLTIFIRTDRAFIVIAMMLIASHLVELECLNYRGIVLSRTGQVRVADDENLSLSRYTRVKALCSRP